MTLNLLLEVLPELTPRWDVLVMDNGSTDATVEVAHELVGRYPQGSSGRECRAYKPGRRSYKPG